MKLKPQPPLPRRGAGPKRTGAARARARPGSGRMARRPGLPLRQRLGRRLPSIRRLLAGTGAVAGIAVTVALLNGPWLRVTDIAWAGDRYTADAALGDVLATQDGASILAIDTAGVRERLMSLPSVDDATVAVSLTGRLEATIVEHEPAFVWTTPTSRFIGAADGTVFAGGSRDDDLDPSLADLPRIHDGRSSARVMKVGDVLPDAVLRVALRLAEVDPALLGSTTEAVALRIDDEYGFRVASADPAWEIAFGVYGLDPRETPAEADARLERQVTAVRTLFATRQEGEIGWVDVRNPGKVYFRAKG